MTYISVCCGAAEQMTVDGEPVYSRETGYCAKCKDHTEFEPERSCDA